MNYVDFLKNKVQMAPQGGFDVSLDEINPILLPHQKAMVVWACRGGRRAVFAKFGLGKSVIQIEILRIITARFGGRGLIVTPLGVRQEFRRDAHMLATGDHPRITDAQRAELRAWQAGRPDRIPTLEFIRSIDDAGATGLYMTNYETVRDGKLDPHQFDAVSLDEASCLRGFGGSKTFREFMRLFDGVRFKFVATATPSPNQFIELLAYSAFLEIMDVGQAKTRFFKRNSEKADSLTIHPHKQREFWLWVASWALFVQKPSDLGFSDEGYDLPAMVVHWHELPADHASAGAEKNGQSRLFRNASASLSDAAREKRDSLPVRIAKLMELRAENPDAHRLIWHDLEAERLAIEAAIPGIATVYGSQDLDAREETICAFSDGRLPELAGKPSMLGSGPNFQYHCWWEIFLGIGFKFNDFIQGVHRIYRFMQDHEVRLDLIYTEAERPVRDNLQEKWQRHEEQMQIMTDIIKEYGLSSAAMAATLQRSLGVDRIEVSGDGYRLINNDCVLETQMMAADSVDLIVTSIPFSTQYEYSPNYCDFGHTDDNDHFWQQMDFLIPELLRVLSPGRIAAIHVKDRIVPGGLTGLGFQTVYPFSDDCVARFKQHGFAFLSRKTITTDVVRENNQTYRLGWSEQCKDGSRMGNGMPEYLLIFRKPPSDASNGYADRQVKKDKRQWSGADGAWSNETGYSRARWQLDAHGFMPSSGNRLLTIQDLAGLEHHQIFKLWKRYSLDSVYDFEHHVKIAEVLEERGMLPSTFMLLPPHSKHNDVWTDITRMLSMNTLQAQAGKEMHLCPLQFDIVDRAISQYTEPGETIFDPFGGLMTVPYRAIKLGRKGIATELNPAYFLDGCKYVEAAARDMAMPNLFDLLEAAQ
ncbi:DNA methylase N-4 [Agrobacterium vitis]|uniref:DNA methyltransferase n=1 Tax=Agrobacterium vitis TaxID=373 RepID=UPI0008FB7370|nr:DNA methyltransferase [Agrobacterium vitis]MUZ53054.1 DNA methylase N-4 [Agrobacterium vitis]MUZ91273.1 DNA methylase N-4 [Agrobacterium vitis]MVA40283.1 DNA methylase N-4 [Agrobacterium vitis]NSX96129.1 DNA methylase N-4 [Agrobacterium vitis]NSZ27268.1 DNA methylase N-4 [Agrobacterium vitis]